MTTQAPKSGRWIVLGLAVLIVLLPIGAYVGVVVPRASRRASLAARLDRALTEQRAWRWERPVLRGEPLPGNGARAQEEAIQAFGTLPPEPFEGFEARALLPPTDAQQALLERHAAALARYRAATQHAFAVTHFPVELGFSAPFPEYLQHLRAVKLLLIQAIRAPPGECLAICTDVVRLGQDRVAGVGLVPLMVHAAHARDVLPVAARYIDAADAATLAQAERELAILARHPAPSGSAMEVEALLAGYSLRDEYDRAPTVDGYFAALLGAGDRLEAWQLLMGEPHERRRIGEDYPADIERIEEFQRDLAARDNGIIGGTGYVMDRYLRRDAGARAIVRMLWAATRLRLEHDAPPEEGTLLSDPELLDPLTGAPFAHALDDGALTLSSIETADAFGVGEILVRVRWPAP